MTDFELRIGPKATPSQEEKPVYNHKVWTRPGYQPPLRLVSPKKPRTLRHSEDWSLDYSPPTVAEGDLSLLARMGLDVPSPSRSGNGDYGNRRMSVQHFSARKEGDTTEESGTGAITLGNHHLESPSTHDSVLERDSLINDGLSNNDSCAPHGSSRLHSLSGSNGRYPPRGPRITSVDSPRRRTSNARRPDSTAAIVSEVSNTAKSGTESPSSSWSQLPLKDRIAPLVRQNLELRLSQNRFVLNSNRGEEYPDNESLDAILTPEVCNSIADSLDATRSQLAEKNAAQLSQQNLELATCKRDKVHYISPLTEPPTTPFITKHPPSANTQTPLSKPLLPTPPTPLQMPIVKATSSPEQPANAGQGKVPSSATTCPSSNIVSQQIDPIGSVALPVDAQKEAIPIPLNAVFFNRAPTLPTLPNTASSFGTVFHTSIKHGRNVNVDSESSHRQSLSPNPRPYKRLRSRSPSTSSSHQYLNNKDRSRRRGSGRDTSDSSSARRDLLPSPSISSSRRQRRHESPNTSQRSGSPSSRSRRSVSPSRSRRSRSPRSRDSGYSESHRQTSLVHRQNTSPSRSRDLGTSRNHSSRLSAKEPSELMLSPTSQKSSYKKYSHLETTGERYVTAYERERRAREARKGEENQGEASPRQQSAIALSKNKERRQSNASTGESIVDGRASLPRAAGKPTSQSSTLLIPSASKASCADCSAVPRQTWVERTNLDASSKLASEGAQPSSNAYVATGEKEASIDADVDLLTTSVDAEVQASTQIKDAEAHSWKPFSDIPGIWLFRQGSSVPDVTEETFEVTKEIVQKWQPKPLQANLEKSVLTSTSFDEALSEPKSASSPTFSWSLMCATTESVDSLRDALNKSATAKELLQELSSVQSRWPTNGQLIIEINPDHDIGGTLYANNLDSANPCMEVKGHMHTAAPNVIRLIQLGDMSKYVFILFATPVLEPAKLRENDVSLENLQMLLQKSRIEKGSASMTGSVIIQKL